MRNRIVEANFKWRQAQMMVDYARKQLEFAVQKWKDIEQIDPRLVLTFYYCCNQRWFNLRRDIHSITCDSSKQLEYVSRRSKYNNEIKPPPDLYLYV